MARALAADAALVHYRKGELLLREGEVSGRVGFLVSGLVRSFFTDAEGHDATDCLVVRPGAVLAPSPELRVPSPDAVETLAESDMAFVPLAVIERLLQTSLAANQLYARIVAEAWREHWEVRRAVSQLRARERYLWFAEKNPELVELAPSKYVASLLGMTPVTLSRLRSEIRSEDGRRMPR
nr:cyclic nucleotide-binding domain-containing protein [Olsenella profusa]